MTRVVSIYLLLGLSYIFSQSSLAANFLPTESMILNYGNEATKHYERLSEKAADNKDKPFVEHMVKDKTIDPAFWDALVMQLIQNDQLGSSDLMWIIDKHSIPTKEISPEQAKLLFDRVITKNLVINPQNRKVELSPRVMELLFYIDDDKKNDKRYQRCKYWGNEICGESTNIFFSMIEKGYSTAISEILALWPEEMGIGDYPVYTFEKLASASGLYGNRTFSYKPMKYLLHEWLSRPNNNITFGYLEGDNAKPIYVEVAKKIIEKEINANNTLSSMLGMALCLHRNMNLPENVSLKKIVAKISGFPEIDIKVIPDSQKEEITKSLEKGTKLYNLDTWRTLIK